MSVALDLNAAILKAMSSVPECVGAGYIDVASGLVLGSRLVDSLPADIVDLLAAAVAEMFQGPNVIAVESFIKKLRGIETSHHFFQEITVHSDNMRHIFMRGRKNQDYVLALVCRKTVNFGLALAKARAALPIVEVAI